MFYCESQLIPRRVPGDLPTLPLSSLLMSLLSWSLSLTCALPCSSLLPLPHFGHYTWMCWFGLPWGILLLRVATDTASRCVSLCPRPCGMSSRAWPRHFCCCSFLAQGSWVLLCPPDQSDHVSLTPPGHSLVHFLFFYPGLPLLCC